MDAGLTGLIPELLDSLEIKDTLLAIVARISKISFSALGVVFIAIRYFQYELSAKAKKKIALYSMAILSPLLILWYDYSPIWAEEFTYLSLTHYLFSSLFYFLLSCVFYAIICFKFINIVNVILFERLLKIPGFLNPEEEHKKQKPSFFGRLKSKFIGDSLDDEEDIDQPVKRPSRKHAKPLSLFQKLLGQHDRTYDDYEERTLSHHRKKPHRQEEPKRQKYLNEYVEDFEEDEAPRKISKKEEIRRQKYLNEYVEDFEEDEEVDRKLRRHHTPKRQYLNEYIEDEEEVATVLKQKHPQQERMSTRLFNLLLKK